MDQADSVHSTPPTNTSANKPPGGPESPQDSLYLPTDVSPEEVFQAIGRLRKEARDAIDELIRFLDKTDDYISRELEDDDDREEVGDDEPDLGSFDLMADQSKAWRQISDGWVTPEVDAEQDDADAEPSLGAFERHVSGYGPDGYNCSGDQTKWASGGSGDLEDEHDGAEPEDEGGDGAVEDDEPSLGWGLNGETGNQGGHDREEGAEPRLPQDRTDLGLGVHAAPNYCHGSRIRGLTAAQEARLRGR